MKRISQTTSFVVGLSLASLFSIPSAVSAQGKPNLHWMQSGFQSPVSSVAYSTNGKFLAVISQYNLSQSASVRVYRASDQRLLRTFTIQGSADNSNTFSGVTLSADGSIVAASYNNNLVFWRVTDGTYLRTFSVPNLTNNQTPVPLLSPDGKMLALTLPFGDIGLYSVANGALIQTLPTNLEQVYALAFSKDGQTLLSSGGGNARLWRVSDGHLLQTMNIPAAMIVAVAYSPNGTLVATGDTAGNVSLWNPANGTLVRTLSGHNQDVVSVAFSPDGQTVASGSNDRTAKLWKTSDGTLLRNLTNHTAAVTKVAFSADGSTLTTVGNAEVVKQWRVADGTFLGNILQTIASILTVAYSPDGTKIATGDGGNLVRLWRASDGTLLKTLSGHDAKVNTVAFSPDGVTLASGSDDQTIKFWNTNDGSLIDTYYGHTKAVQSITFSPDGMTLTSGGADNLVQLWSIFSAVPLYSLNGHTSPVSSVAYSPDGSTLASTDGVSLKLWRVSDGSAINSFTSVLSTLAFSPDGLTLAGASGNNVGIMRVSDGKSLSSLIGHYNPVTSVSFASNGQTLVSGSADGTLRHWRVSDGKMLRIFDRETGAGTSLYGNQGGINALAVSPNGRLLTYVRPDGTVASATVPTNQNTLLLQRQTDGAIYYWKTANAVLGASDYLWTGGDANMKVVGTPDLNGDGVPDVLFQNAQTGQPFAWILDSTQTKIVSMGNLTANGTTIGNLSGWNVVATPDLNHDGKSDIVLQNASSGAVYYWAMDGLSVTSQGYLWTGGDANYRLFAMTDLDGDGIADALFQYKTTGNVYKWILNSSGTGIESFSGVWTTGLGGWNAVTAGETLGDGSVRVILQNTNGSVYEWSLIGGSVTRAGYVYNSSLPGWTVKGLADLTGDGKPDVVLQKDGGVGEVYYWGLDGMSLLAQGFLYNGNLANWKVVSPK